VVSEDSAGVRHFRFQPGPIFANLVLADEINRATPKTQSALLEAMQEQTVTIANEAHLLPRPFFVLATQNPIEMEGTYPLPEAELDRFFFKLNVRYPSRQELHEILHRTTGAFQQAVEAVADGEAIIELQAIVREVPIASYLTDFAARLVLATHPDVPESPELVKRFVRYGASPRAGQALVLAAKIHALLNGRFNVSHDDLRLVAPPALRHRLILNFEAESHNVNADQVIGEVLDRVPESAKT
jgi:MoxR-like ATPase